jgi:hypothetical protein
MIQHTKTLDYDWADVSFFLLNTFFIFSDKFLYVSEDTRKSGKRRPVPRRWQYDKLELAPL